MTSHSQPRSQSGRHQATHVQKSASRTFCTCRADCGSGRPRIPIMIHLGLIPTTSIFTPVVGIPFTTRRRGPNNGPPTQLDATATPIRY